MNKYFRNFSFSELIHYWTNCLDWQKVLRLCNLSSFSRSLVIKFRLFQNIYISLKILLSDCMNILWWHFCLNATQEDLAKMGVMIRHYNNKELKGYVRVSVGKPEQTDALMKGLRQFYWSTDSMKATGMRGWWYLLRYLTIWTRFLHVVLY